MPRVLVPVGDASEDIETSTITDVMVRAGIEYKLSSVMGRTDIKFARGLRVTADSLIEDEKVDDYDAVLLPGGMPGAQHLRDSAALVALLGQFKAGGKLVGAICASPCIVLSTLPGYLDGVKSVTCFPKLQDKLKENLPGADVVDANVVLDGKFLTSQGPGTTFAFALAAVAQLVGEDKAKEVAAGLLVPFP
eukprot:Hpha_TRINITY_DN22451_c0_g1::TRINITY_DN22451_c0_g1_i1::g.95117::m.95117/K03152/thiJ; protein deglycase